MFCSFYEDAEAELVASTPNHEHQTATAAQEAPLIRHPEASPPVVEPDDAEMLRNSVVEPAHHFVHMSFRDRAIFWLLSHIGTYVDQYGLAILH